MPRRSTRKTKGFTKKEIEAAKTLLDLKRNVRF